MVEVQLTVPAEHPALPGHFPGDGLIPGVVLLDWAWDACCAVLPPGTRLAGVETAKFLAPVRPGEVLRIAVSLVAGQAHFSIYCGERLAAQGRFRHVG